MQILIIGADGQLGSDLVEINPQAIPLTIKDLDITNLNKCEEVLAYHRPGMVINTAAYNDVDGSENSMLSAFNINAIGAGNVARVCKELGAALIHLSTDYIFSGDKTSPYLEDDLPAPLQVYGASKLAGEHLVRAILPEHYIVRTSGLFGRAGSMGKGGANFVETMIKKAKSGQSFKVVNNEIVGPTYTRDLAAKIYELMEVKSFGFYHITNSGQCSWFEFAQKIFEYLNLSPAISPVLSQEFKAAARRPHYSVLAHKQLQSLGLNDLRPWQDALKAYLKEKGYLRNQ